jgi:uncharacterized protein
MQLTHRFTLPASVEQAWTAFYFAHRIAPCFPGATLTRVAGDEFDGVLKIKLGPTPLQYEGTATFLERSAEEQRIVVEAHGEDRRGHGTITVTVSMTFTESESETHVEVTSTAEFTGGGASFGQTVVQEASDRLVQRLIECVSEKFANGLGDLPTAEELATAAAAEHAAPQRAVGRGMSEVAESQEAVQPNREPAANVAAERKPPPEAAGKREPASEPAAEREPAPEREPTTPEVAAEPEPTAEITTEPEPTAEITTEPEPTAEITTEPEPSPEPAAEIAAERQALDADEASASDTDHATAASGVADDSGATQPFQPALPDTAGPQGSALATVVMPRVRRFGPPVLGALVAMSVISGIVRRIRR